MNARILVPWTSVSDALGDLGGPDGGGLAVEVFTGDAPGPADLGDVVFFTVPYDRPFNTEPIPRLSGVRVVQTLTAGYDDVAPLIPGGATLCTARGLHDSSTAEHALALILAAQRELPRWVRAQDEGRWEHAHTRSLADCRVLIVGYGSIGSALDARLRACQAETVRVARRSRPDEDVFGVAELDGLLPAADIVVLITPLSAETRGLLDARRLALLPDGALVVNVGRGPVLDTSAILAETASGRLRAALDVTDPEPLPSGHPLWHSPGTIITPHVAGGADAFYPRAADFIVQQVRRFAAGEPLRNVVGFLAPDRHGASGDGDRPVAWGDADDNAAWSSHVVSLSDGHLGRRRHPAEFSQIGAEGSGCGAGGRVFVHAADGERVTGMVEAVSRCEDEVDRRQVLAEHECLERLEVVVEPGEALAGGCGQDQVPGTCVGNLRGERGIEFLPSPVKRRQGRLDICRGHIRDRWGDTGERGGDRTGRVLLGGDRDDPGQDMEDKLAGPVALGQGDRSGDRRMPAERHLRLRAEVTDVILAVRSAVTTAQEGGLRIAEVPGDGEPVAVAEGGCVEYKSGGIAADGTFGERGVAEDDRRAAMVTRAEAHGAKYAKTQLRGSMPDLRTNVYLS